MEFDKDEKYTIGQRELLLRVKSELEDLREKIGSPIEHNSTEYLLLHRIVERVVLWNQSMKTYKKFVVSVPSYKKPDPIESLTIEVIIKKDKKKFEGKPNVGTVAEEYPNYKSLLELLKEHHDIVGLDVAMNRVLKCITWLIETIVKDSDIHNLPPFLKDTTHHASPASTASSASPAASPSPKKLTGRFGPSPKPGKRIAAGGKKKGRKTCRVSRKYRR
jgi:hypothetical protein